MIDEVMPCDVNYHARCSGERERDICGHRRLRSCGGTHGLAYAAMKPVTYHDLLRYALGLSRLHWLVDDPGAGFQHG